MTRARMASAFTRGAWARVMRAYRSVLRGHGARESTPLRVKRRGVGPFTAAIERRALHACGKERVQQTVSSPGSAFDEDHKGGLADAVVFHRFSTCVALHDRLERIHVGNIHT